MTDTPTFTHVPTSCINEATRKAAEVLASRLKTCNEAIDKSIALLDTTTDTDTDEPALSYAKLQQEKLGLEGAVEGVNFLISLIQREADTFKSYVQEQSQPEVTDVK